MDARPPRRIETKRLVLRPLEPEEAHLLKAAVDASLEALKAWVPWAAGEPTSLEEKRAYLARAALAFDAGEDFTYPILNSYEDEVVGSSGLHLGCGEGCLEIGYWIRTDRAGNSYATEAAAALTEIALGLDGVHRVIIRCDPDNRASRRVAEKLGYTLVERRSDDFTTPRGELRDTLVYELRSRGSSG